MNMMPPQGGHWFVAPVKGHLNKRKDYVTALSGLFPLWLERQEGKQ